MAKGKDKNKKSTNKESLVTSDKQAEQKANIDAPENSIASASEKTAIAKTEIEQLEAELKAAAEKSNTDVPDSRTPNPGLSQPQKKSNATKSDDSPTETKPGTTATEPEPEPEPEPKNSALKSEKPSSFSSSQSSTSSDKNSTSPNQSSSKNKAQPKRFSWLAFFAFILSLIALSACGYIWWQAQQFVAQQSKMLEQTRDITESSAEQLSRTVNSVRNNLSQLQSNQQQSNNFVIETERSLQSLNNRIKQLGQSQPNTWLAAESLYLVNLAEHRLLIEKDSATAIKLLMDANIRLTAMQDPSVFYIRTAISEDIAALNAIVKPDTESAFLGLSGAIKQIQTLPLARKYTPEPATENAVTEVSGDMSDWKQNLLNSFKKFVGNFITITRHDTKIEPELPPKQRWFVRANVTSQLLAAQNASLQNNQAIYSASVEQAITWITQYFDLSKPEVIATLETLKAIKLKSVTVTLPQGLASQPLLKNYLNSQMQLQQTKSNDAVGGQ